MDYEYNFVGETLKERKIYRRTGEADLTIITTYTRDHTGRVIATTHTLNGIEKDLATYDYDDIGRLKRKKISPFEANITRTATPPNNTQDLATQWVQLLPNTTITATATNIYVACITPRDALQTIDYSYHIRGTVNCINCSNGTPTLNATENDLFAMRLFFEEDGRYYNGQISKQAWQSPLTPSGGIGVTRSFTYTYDMADRLKSGIYAGGNGENYNLTGVTYDQNGNIQSLQRFGLLTPPSGGGGAWGLIDNLNYDYGTAINQLQSITDATGNANGFASTGLGAYAYWPDGSLKKDLNKGIAEITYNYLTLPQRVSFTDGRWIDFFYDAEGSKYKQTYSDGREYHYQGDVIYFKTSGQPLKVYEIQHDEGRVVSNGSTLVYEYGYYDHLGNLRVSYIDSAGVAVISQQNDYDPWGVPLIGLNRASRFANANFYTFNGQEQLDFGYQNMGWRWMDNLIGRMSGIDPMHQFDSDYVGLGNNPVARIDPDGRIAPLVIAGAALVGGSMNLWSNWGKVKNFKQGLAYFASGAVGGAVSVVNPALGGTITAGGNVVTDIATGNMPTFKNGWDAAKYVGGVALDGFSAAGAGKLAKFGVTKISSLLWDDAVAGIGGQWGATTTTRWAGGGFESVANWEIVVKPTMRGTGQSLLAQGSKLLSNARGNLLSAAENSKLKSVIDYTYRKGASIGSGSTGEAIRYELQGGKLINSSSHLQKAQEALNSYRDLLKGNYGQLSNLDRKLIFEQIQDLTKGTGLSWKGLNFDYLKNIPR